MVVTKPQTHFLVLQVYVGEETCVGQLETREGFSIPSSQTNQLLNLFTKYASLRCSMVLFVIYTDL